MCKYFSGIRGEVEKMMAASKAGKLDGKHVGQSRTCISGRGSIISACTKEPEFTVQYQNRIFLADCQGLLWKVHSVY